MFVPQAPDQCEELVIAYESPLPFGCPDDDGNVLLPRGLEDCSQDDEG